MSAAHFIMRGGCNLLHDAAGPMGVGTVDACEGSGPPAESCLPLSRMEQTMKTAILGVAVAGVWAISDSKPLRAIATGALVVGVAADITSRVRRRRKARAEG